MVEINIASVDKTEPVTPMQEINRAYEVCKFGRFHVKLLLVSFFGCIASLLVTNSTSYLLPIAECDLNMNLRQKGLLTAMPYFGMFVSTIIAGFLSDTFGRIYFLRIGFGGIFVCTLFAASSQTYEMLAVAKLCEGILYNNICTRSMVGPLSAPPFSCQMHRRYYNLENQFATSTGAISSLTSEFCHTTVRDRVMLCQSSFAALAQIICPAMAWGMLVQDWRYSFFDGRFVLNIWNFYLLAMSLWSLIAVALYATFPESPKFLVTQKRYVEARNVLVKMYSENSGKPADTFPYPNIFDKEIQKEEPKKDEEETKAKVRDRIVTGLKNMKPLLGRPLLGYLAMIGFMQFIILGIHNFVRLWFPQLSTIVEHYKFDGNQNLCGLLDAYTGSLKMKSVTNLTSGVCVPHVSGAETYINSITIGAVSILPYFISGVIVNKVGKKVLLFVGGLISMGSLLGLRWVNSKTMMVTLFSMNIATTQIMKSLTQVVLIDVFPTTMRTVALSITMLLARMGTLGSNVTFPILLSMGCPIPFYTMASMMSCVIVMSLFLPKKKQQ